VSQKRYREPRRRLTGDAVKDGVRTRIRELIHEPFELLMASGTELVDLCKAHHEIFAVEYMSTWPEAQAEERLFRRLPEEFAALRIDPGDFTFLCLHRLVEFPAESQAFFRYVWLGSRSTWTNGHFTEAERDWLERNVDRLGARSHPGDLLAGQGYVDIGLDYARKVASGKIPACQWVRFACQRQLDDLKRAAESHRQAPAETGNVVPFTTPHGRDGGEK
jgi:hypothetical protein